MFRVTSLMIIINFAIQFGYYGLWLWFPELFNKLNIYYTAHPEESIGVCEVGREELKLKCTVHCFIFILTLRH